MKQRTRGFGGGCLHSKDEMEVAGILLELPNLILNRHLQPLSIPSWGIKRRRSMEDSSPFRGVCSPPAVFPSPQEIAGILSSAFPIEKPAAKVEEATSPATPLSFSPSESDEKRKPDKRLKRKFQRKEDLLLMKNDSIQSNEIIREEIEESRGYLMLLQAENQRLQARKQELTLSYEKGKSHVDNSASANNAHHHNHHQQQEHVAVDQRHLMIDRTARNVQTSEKSCYDQYQYGKELSFIGSRNGMAMGLIINGRVGQSNIPDLNEPPPPLQEESAIFYRRSYQAMAAAQARQNRIKINREKNLNKLRLQHK